MSELDLDAIDRLYPVNSYPAADLVAEVRRLRERNATNEATIERLWRQGDTAREVARWWIKSGRHGWDRDVYLSQRLDRLAETCGVSDPPPTDDPWTLHGEAQDTLRADGEREERR